MTQDEIIENNRLIVKFLGWKEKKHDLWVDESDKEIQQDLKPKAFLKEMRFHYSWDCLIPVVQKCQIEIDKILGTNNRISYSPKYGYIINFNSIPITKPIETIYNEVIRFIKKYNNEKF